MQEMSLFEIVFFSKEKILMLFCCPDPVSGDLKIEGGTLRL